MMNFVQEEKGYSNNNEEDKDHGHQKERIIRETSKLPFSFSSSSSSVSSPSKYKHFLSHHHQNSWLLGPFFDFQQVYNKTQEAEAEAEAEAAAATNFDNKVELMDLSLGNNNNNNEQPPSGNGTSTCESSGIMSMSIEKEHMFDKVVTPSDVGKLNRLVIPKQHAERYFPIDSSSNEKGLLLNFEDRNGKAWRFRYSYWNSSQSYVMTKGWSRFVKDKKLDAGDIVSFQRGVGDMGKNRLYIDWRRRPDIVPDHPTSFAQMQLQNQLRFQQSVRWGTRPYSLPQSLSLPRNYDHLQRIHYNTIQNNQQQILGYANASTQPVQYYLRPSGSQQIEGGHMPMVIDSVPVVPGKSTAAKRLRLFGVNMECPTTQVDQSPANISAPILASRQTAEYSNKGKSSFSIDLDL